MTTEQRASLPDTTRTNGATPNPWWANAVVYQIYPRSFQDSDGDGIGDIPGIISRLDYLADLGVDVIWLSPVFRSPQDDNGYDIADYQDIEPMFGTMDDMDRLIAAVHERGMKLIMDLVVNHTSDEHAWFQASRDKDDPHADWYIWRKARPGFKPGEPGAEPNRWGSYFGGSIWQYDERRGEYYLHQYSRKQPDLNWENPAVRHAVYDMMNWWMDRGIDGFRMDVITQISKPYDAAGLLPGEEGASVDELPLGPEGYSNAFPFCSDGPRLDEYLAEMRREVFAGREGFITVGEAPGITPERNRHITDPRNGELDMLFIFNHTDVDHGEQSMWDVVPWRLTDLKATLGGQQRAVADAGWASLFFCNHDQPRVVSRWGDDSNEESRARSAKAIGLLLHMHRGTPYVYQGEELGMTNAHFTSLDQYQDIQSHNMYRQRVLDAGIVTHEQMMDSLAQMSRDNARTPMQWDASKYAGFMPADADVEPWLTVNPNHEVINAAAEVDDPRSVHAFYKRLIALRHEDPTVAAGDWTLVDADDESVYAFTRTLGDETLLVMVNMTGGGARIPSECRGLLGGEIDADAVLIATYDPEHAARSASAGALAPWEGMVVRL
ncbi:glycoside hydrolase family 13 protein [Bifidobacterium phasiani]|uniref:Alpha-glucosidase n=1 Tax=Bifidobacterium phasiani TaxID=2834431 RepID=A0ABS6W852_9BIFI|nr:alpha-glucosidase [Bifidobacterium phasiani]MBW3082650.1 alpha-glucosidase [Bifidobacterium phasiani]